jgi:deoxyribodipyrimidine photo-lyase
VSAIVWFRRDLRVQDHAALAAAVAAGLPITALYIHAPKEAGAWKIGGASSAWLLKSLVSLDQSLQKMGVKLLIRRGKSAQVLSDLVNEVAATHVFWHRLYEADAVQRDTEIKAMLKAQGIIAASFAGHLLNEPWAFKTGAGDVYRVFTPYWRNAMTRLSPSVPLIAPRRMIQAHNLAGEIPVGLAPSELKLASKIPWDQAFWSGSAAEKVCGDFTPGEAGAADALEVFCDGALAHYTQARDRPDQIGTSRMGPHLHFGEISVNQIAYRFANDERAQSAALRPHAEFYLRELGWRDFSHQLLFYFPHTTTEALNVKFAAFPWADPSVDGGVKLRAWQQGRTGIPIVDAGMRELYTTGWMHNRVRMIVASFLTKNLRYHWLHGARWFWDTLLDADLASNTQGWQWSAGTGADAAPYFRVFNPVTQGEKFDANGDYVRKFVPELAHLPNNVIHQPWTMGGVKAYPAPIVDLKLSREAALSAFATLKSGLTA